MNKANIPVLAGLDLFRCGSPSQRDRAGAEVCRQDREHRVRLMNLHGDAQCACHGGVGQESLIPAVRIGLILAFAR
jgi:hypothetical protein